MGNITHEFVSAIEDGDDDTLVKPSNWNADHAVSAPVDDHDVATKGYVDDADDAIDVAIAVHAAIEAADATLGHVIVESGSLIDVDGSGKLTLGAHASTHQNGGSDEIEVAGLSGLLADDQHVLDTEVDARIAAVAPKAHKASHQNGGSDEISIAGLDGESAELTTHKADTTTAHGAVSAATASKHVVRDASARAKFAAPGASGDAMIKGTRATVSELPAMTDEKIWKGTGTDVEEVDVYTDAAAVAAAKTVKLDDLTAPDDTVDLDAADSLHGLMSKADKGKLDGVEAGATADQDLSGLVAKTLFNANTILIATDDDTPVALEIAASRIAGRKSSGGIIALTGAELMAILSGQAGADFSMNTKKITSVVDPTSDQHAATKKYADDTIATHAALALSGAVHPNTALCRAFLIAEQSNLPNVTQCRCEMLDTNFDPGSNWQAGVWQGGVGDAGSNATTIIDANPTTGAGFVASMLRALVTWDAGASTGYITSIDSGTQVTIVKNLGTNFAPGDTYVINESHYLVPTSGIYIVFGQVVYNWVSMLDGKQWNSLVIVNGVIINNTILQSGRDSGVLSVAFGDMLHFDADDLVALAAIEYAGDNLQDLIGNADGAYTNLSINLVQAD